MFVYSMQEIEKIKQRIKECGGIPIKEIGVTRLISTIEQLYHENNRLEKFIETLQNIHEVEKARLRAEIDRGKRK